MRAFIEQFPVGSGRAAFAPPFADYVEDVVLAADTLLRVALPAGSRFVVLSFDADVRARVGTAGTTFTLPTSGTADGSGSELNPAARRIPAKLGDGTTVPTHLCLRASAACKGSLAFYA